MKKLQKTIPLLLLIGVSAFAGDLGNSADDVTFINFIKEFLNSDFAKYVFNGAILVGFGIMGLYSGFLAGIPFLSKFKFNAYAMIGGVFLVILGAYKQGISEFIINKLEGTDTSN